MVFLFHKLKMQLSETTEVIATMSLRDNAHSAWKLPIWGMI